MQPAEPSKECGPPREREREKTRVSRVQQQKKGGPEGTEYSSSKGERVCMRARLNTAGRSSHIEEKHHVRPVSNTSPSLGKYAGRRCRQSSTAA